MELVLAPDGSLSFESSVVSLREVHPVLNGVPFDDARPEILAHDATRTDLRYTAPGLGDGAFGLELVCDTGSCAWLRYWITGGAAAPDAFGIRFERIEGLTAYLRSGYHSWDGSAYVEPGADRPHGETGYAMTQLLPRNGSGCIVLGFDRHDRYQQTFAFDGGETPGLTIQTVWDRKPTGPAEDEAYRSERLVIFEHAGVEEALAEWARFVAKAAPVKPHRVPPITGWSSWYNLYASISEDVIREHLRGVEKMTRQAGLPMRIFQIDDGFAPEMGDWLDVKPQFPRGMKPLLDEIRAAGFVPGLWIAPFMVGNRSRLYREHPDWVVQDVAGGPLVQWRMYGEFRWHKRSEEYYILDTTHPAAAEYLRRVFRAWRHEWGCRYFKTDFMFWGAEYGPERARWHRPGLTRIEIWRRAAEMIRAEISDATWLGCGCPLWAGVGLVDAVRIGRDIGVEWRDSTSARALFRDVAARNFANGILWQADPDCILLRERFHHLTDAELTSLALFAGMVGGVTMTSDTLDALSPDRLQLWSLLLAPGACRFPFLGGSDPVLVQVREGVKASAVLVLNSGDAPARRTYALSRLGIEGARYTYDWGRRAQGVSQVADIAVDLAPHESALLFLSPLPFQAAPVRLP